MNMRISISLAAALCGAALFYGCSSSSSSDNGAGDGGPDGTADVAHKEAAPGDDSSSGDDGSTSTCPTPADVSMFMPPAYKKAKSAPTACTAQDITDYDAACINSTTATGAKCTAYKTAHAACAACMTSQSTDATWGPLVVFTGVINLNIGGCLELTDPNAATCAKALQASTLCDHAACDTVCKVTSTDPNSFPNWQKCQQTADTQGCASYLSAAQCLGNEDAAAAAACNINNAGSFEAAFLAIAPVFCGGSSGDGGTSDGGSDAPPG